MRNEPFDTRRPPTDVLNSPVGPRNDGVQVFNGGRGMASACGRRAAPPDTGEAMLRPDTTRPYRNPLSLIVCRTTQRVANWEVTGYTSSVIVRFRHKGLQNLYERGDRRRVPSTHVAKIERILARLDEASDPAGMDLPGFRLHSLKGSLAGYWAVSVSRNWLVMFRFQGDHVSDVDLVDYH